MLRSRWCIPFLLAFMCLFSSLALAAEHEHMMKVGKKGEVVFSAPTKVGDLTLKPGTYRVQHRVEGEQHFIRFEALGASGTPGPGEVQCKVEPLSKKVSQTAVYTTTEDTGSRVTKVEIGGENVAHVF